jgi:hypothetical protein
MNHGRRSLLLALVGSMSLVHLASAGTAATVEICHFPPGNPAKFQTITIRAAALRAHLAQGDFPGPCADDCNLFSSVCNDGNPCTEDICSANGTCSNPAKSDGTPCDDGNSCTQATCQAGVCVSTPTGAPGSIIVIEHLQVDATDDPLLSLANARDQTVVAHCFYADTPCNLISFVVQLSPQSQMQWQAGLGDSSGGVPALPPGFSGELVCVETDLNGFPIPVQALVGSVQYPGQCPIAATTIHGYNTNNEDYTLCLGGTVPTTSCPFGLEYSSCPSSIDPSRIACWSQSAFVFVCG